MANSFRNNLAVIIAALITAELVCHASCSSSKKQPHIVFILADDYGFHDVGYHGSHINTPTLDGLAEDGVKLENYYVQPLCSPSRSQLMSGRYQIHTGLQHSVIKPEVPNALPDDSPTLPDKLKEAGYSTHMVGKWHLGFYKERYLPWNRGFDTYYGYFLGMEDSYYTQNRTCSIDGYSYVDLHTQDGPVWTERGSYSAHLFTEQAITVVENHNATGGDTPMFLYLAYQSVQSPLEVPASYEEKYAHIKDKDRRTYAGMVAAMDEGIHNLTQALKDQGMWEDTILVFSSDNGGDVKAGGNNFPLRGWKASLWEGGVHGVGFVSGGRLEARGAVSRGLMHISDWYPTLVGLGQGSLAGTLPLDGVDQWQTITTNAPSNRHVLLHNIDPLMARQGVPLYNDTFDTSIQAAIRVGDMKLITGNPLNGSWISPPEETHSKRFLMEEIHEAPDKNVWLFNITADPTEHHDLSDAMPAVVRELLGHLQDLSATAVPCRFPPKDPQSNPGLRLDVWGPWQ